MTEAGFFQQVFILFNKTVRIAWREHFYKSIAFSAIIAVLVMAVVGGDMLEGYGETRSGFFTLASACIWIGIFNTIQSICKEHEIIHADTRNGMMLSAFVTANVMWQFIVCILEAAVIYGISAVFVSYNTDSLIFDSTAAEYFLTIFLLLFGSACLGMLISAVANNGTVAMTIMPFVLILQLIMCGVLFKLEGVMDVISYITFSKWGMSAFGAISDMNGLIDPPPGDLATEFGQIRSPFEPIEAYDHTPETLLTAWIWLVAVTLGCALLTTLTLKLRNRE